MNTFFIYELKSKCEEIIQEGANSEMISMVLEAYNRIIKFANIGRKEGLLELEDAIQELHIEDDTQKFFSKLINLVIDGTEPILVKSIGENMCVTTAKSSYLGLINLMYLQGALMIQGGDTIWVIKEMLQSMLPHTILEIVEAYEKSNALREEEEKANSYEEKIRKLSMYEGEIDEEDKSIICIASKILSMLDDRDISKLIDVIDMNILALAMKALPGSTRALVFANLSSEEAMRLVDDMEYMGPVRLRDVENACMEIMKDIMNCCWQ